MKRSILKYNVEKGFYVECHVAKCKSTKTIPTYLKQLNPLSANPTKWSNTLKQIVGNNRRIVCV